MSTSTVTLTRKQWQSFCKTLQGLARQCNDVVINNGIIRQRSNGSAAIFEVDLRPVVGELTLTISYFKEKLKTLKIFKSGVTIELGEKEAIFSDGISSLGILNPDRDYLDNEFMSREELESSYPSVFQATSLLIRNRVEKKMIKRIRKALSKLKASNCKIVYKNRFASLIVEKGMTKFKKSELCVDMIREIPLFKPTIGYTTLSPLPYQSLDFEGDTRWEVYTVGKSFFSYIYGRIGDITATIYTRGELKNDEPEPPPQPEEIPQEEVEEWETEG